MSKMKYMWKYGERYILVVVTFWKETWENKAKSI